MVTRFHQRKTWLVLQSVLAVRSANCDGLFSKPDAFDMAFGGLNPPEMHLLLEDEAAFNDDSLFHD